MSQRPYLKLHFHFGQHQQSQELPIAQHQIDHKEVTISAKELLLKVRNFMRHNNLSIQTYLKIWVIIKNQKVSLFELKKRRLLIPLTSEKGHFDLKIIIEDGSEKDNLISHFQSNFDSYQKLKTNINRVIEENGPKEVPKQKQSSNRPIDIAYFFADPLIKFSAKSGTSLEIMQTQREVSFQVEYDNFIAMVEREQFRRNFRVEMMAATETNIKNTLIQGTSILHFSCHGDRDGNLHIEHEKNIGELAWLTGGKFMEMLKNCTLPRIIIFNACYSYELAKKVSEEKNVIAVGYSGQALDKICEEFTKKFYMGIFRDKKSIKELFTEIKESILQKYPKEGSRLHIFPEQVDFQNMTIISEPQLSKIEYKKRWKVLQSLRRNDCIDVKQEMYKIIKAITNEQRMNYIILEGNKNSGKTNLIQKIRIYAINRKLFTDSLMIDLRINNNGQSRETMLSFRLSFEAQIQQFRNQIEKKRQEEKRNNINCLIIIDHAQNLIYYQYKELIRYVQKQLIDKLNFGEIVILNRREEPYCKQSSIKYALAYKIVKEDHDLDIRQCQTFTKRYFNEDFLKEAKLIKKELKVKWLHLIKAIKNSNQPSQIKEKLDLGKSYPEKLLELHMVEEQLQKLQNYAEEILEDINYEISEHHHLFLSTIFSKIAAREHKKTSLSQTQIFFNKQNMVTSLVNDFKQFFKKAIEQHPSQVIKMFKRLLDLAFVIGGVCYITKCCRQVHFANCQTLNVMASVLLLNPYYQVQLRLSKSFSHAHEEEEPLDPQFQEPQLDNVFKMIKKYEVQLLLTSYTYYTQHSHELQSRQKLLECSNNLLQNPNDYLKKGQIILDQLYSYIQQKNLKAEYELKSTFLSLYKQINHLIHHMQFNIEEHPAKNTQRKYSQNFEDSDEFIHLARDIHDRHLKIKMYWHLFKKIVDLNAEIELISKDSEAVLVLCLIKLIKNNQNWLSLLNSYSPITRDMIGYVELYLQILEKVRDMGIFTSSKGNEPAFDIWRYPQRSSAKSLFKTYYSMFVSAYFSLQKLSQSFTKNYSIKIFNYLLYLCNIFPKINMVSIKKEIQTYKEQQFLSNYSCQTFISIPLMNYNGGKINMKRYESHVHKFQQEFFKNLQRQIRHDIFPLTSQFFTSQQHNSKSLIQLFILNCSDQRVECQTVNSKGDMIKIKDIKNVPKSPVIILFGHNVKYLIDTFRNKGKNSVIITIDTDINDDDIKGSKRQIRNQVFTEKDFLYGSSSGQKWKVKEERLHKLEEYSNKLEVSYSMLQFFYTSFCKHFFTAEHTVLMEQVKKSYQFAQTECLIKAKIRFERGGQFHYSSLIEEQISNIDMNFSEHTKDQFRTKLAYHFMYKQSVGGEIMRTLVKLATLSQKESAYEGIQGEVGCNQEISQFLTQISSENKFRNFVFVYKSKQMVEQFKRTLSYKIKKLKKFEMEAELQVPQQLQQMRKTSSQGNGRNYQQEQQQDQTVKIQIFEDLEEEEFQEEIKQFNSEPLIRIFLTKKRYSTKASNISENFIEERYEYQKVYFQLFFLEMRKQKPSLTFESFKKVLKQESLGLSQIRQLVQKRNNH